MTSNEDESMDEGDSEESSDKLESVGDSEVELDFECENNHGEMSDLFIEKVQQQDRTSSSNLQNRQNRCPLCSNYFIGQDLGVPENCEHVFCFECIEEWGSNINTCPIDGKVFSFVHLKTSPDGNVLKKVDICSKNPKDDAVADDFPGCEVCRRGDREHRLLLCDACNLPYHCDCLDPPLTHMPIEEWFCGQCASVIAQVGGALPSTSQSRRGIPRTKASESVRRRIQSKRMLRNSLSTHPEKRTYPRAILEVVNLDMTKTVGSDSKGEAGVTSWKKHKSRKQEKPAVGRKEDSPPKGQAAECTSVPNRPDKPGKPIVKGQTHSTFFRMAWECPKEDGGCPITEYNLEMNSGKGFESIYLGAELEHMCENLVPGKSHAFRVQCSSLGGKSEFSDIGIAVTLPVVPGKCEVPKVVGQPKANSIHVEWANTEYDGGTEVLGFEIEVIQADGSTQSAFRGSGTDWLVTGLLPGRTYKFRVKAYNIIGDGPWSDPLDAESGAGAPESPVDVCIVPLSPHSVLASWAEPFHNGATISEYRLESKYNDREFELAYSGCTCFAKVKSLIPATMYYFHVQAVNSAGVGPFSKSLSCQTPPSSPGAVSTTSIRMVVGATAICLWWEEPNNHGAPILSYNVKIGDAMYVADGESPERRVEGLIPETTYKVCIQAVNSVGPGPFSSPLKLVTRGLPPLPPTLKCYKTSPNSLQLKWGGGRNLLKGFTLKLENPQTKKFTLVYQGLGNTFKIKRLQESTSYNFRIHASNEEGEGPFSDVFTFTTRKAPPLTQKDPKVSNVKETSCNVERLPIKAIGEAGLSCKLHLCNKESDFYLTSTKTQSPTTSVENNLHPANGPTVKPLSRCPGTTFPDVRPKSCPSTQGSSTKGHFPLFDELLNYNFNEPVVVSSTSTSTPRSFPKKSRIPVDPLNLLDSILAGQEELYKKSNNVILRPDGSFDLKSATEASSTSKLAARLGFCKPSISSKPSVIGRSSSSSLLHGALTKKKSSESDSCTQQKPRTNSSSSGKDTSKKTQKFQRKKDRHAGVEGNSCLHIKKSVDLYLKHREKTICSLPVSPVISPKNHLKTVKPKDKPVSAKDSSSVSHKNLATKSCDSHFASVPTSFSNLPDNKKQSEKFQKVEPSNVQNTVPDLGLCISTKPNASATKHPGCSSPQSSLSKELDSLSGCNVQKLCQCFTVVDGTSPQTNEIKIKDKPLSTDKEGVHPERQIRQADKFSSRTPKPDFRATENLLTNSGTDQLFSTPNHSTIPDSSEFGVVTPTLIKEEPVSSSDESTIPTSENCDILSIRAEIKKEPEELSEDVLNDLPLIRATESFEVLHSMQPAGNSKNLPYKQEPLCIEDLLCSLAVKVPKSKLPSYDHPKTFIPSQFSSNQSSLKCSKSLVEDPHLSAKKTPNISAQEILVSLKCETENSTLGSKEGDNMNHNLLKRQLLEDEVKQLLTELCNKVNTARKVMNVNKNPPPIITSVPARRPLIPKPINKRTCSLEQVKQHFNLEKPKKNNLSDTAINSKSSTQLKSVVETKSIFFTDSSSEHLSKLKTVVQPSAAMLSNNVDASPHENSSKGLAKMTRNCKSKKTSNNLRKTLSYSKLIRLSANKETLQDESHIEANAVNKPTQSFHYSREQFKPIGNKSSPEKQNKHIENNKGNERDLHNNKYSEKHNGNKESSFERKSKLQKKDGGERKQSNSNENKRKTDKGHFGTNDRIDNNAVKDSTARKNVKNNYADKDKRGSKVNIPNNGNKHVVKNKHSRIERNLHSKNKFSKIGNNGKSSASKSIRLDKDKYGIKESSLDKKKKHFENKHDKKKKIYEDVKKKYGEKDQHDRNLYNGSKQVEIDNNNRVINCDRKANFNNERVSYLKIKHSEKEHCHVKESKCDSSNKPILEYSKDSYCDSTTKNSEKDKNNRESDSDKKNKYTEISRHNNRDSSDRNNKHTKFSNKESGFVKDITFVRERKRSVKDSSSNFSSDKSNLDYKRRKMSTEVNKQNSSISAKSFHIPDSTFSPSKTERLAACGSSKHEETLLDASIQKLVNQDYIDIQSSRKRRHESMCSVNSNGPFSDISQLSNEVLLNSGVSSPILEKAMEQKHSASSLKGSVMDGRREGFQGRRSSSSTRETEQSNFDSPGPHRRRDSKKGRTRCFSGNMQSIHSSPNSSQEISVAEWAAKRRKYFGDYNDYSAPLNQQNWTGQRCPNPYSSRPFNVVPVDSFAGGGMGHHSQEHRRHNWNELHGQRNYHAPLHQQDRVGRSHHDAYSDRSRPSSAVPVKRFSQGVEDELGHHRHVHWREYWQRYLYE